ncbi:hypothetical protein RND71_034600 [Anisodus tanguticus]|uniref:Uncharacterized protein n=1 Tax=Anisodus tanguticus TaxID=243964 RepID=A0AAE1RBN9_9SOLA|nr:hypothetical protein RND71_034600 [Anisodus tanguticus]
MGRRNIQRLRDTKFRACSYLDGSISATMEEEVVKAFIKSAIETSHASSPLMQRLVLLDLDPATAKLAISFLGPFLSAFAFLFILRIVMSWYPKLPVGKFPYVIAYVPTSPFFSQHEKPSRAACPPISKTGLTPAAFCKMGDKSRAAQPKLLKLAEVNLDIQNYWIETENFDIRYGLPNGQGQASR